MEFLLNLDAHKVALRRQELADEKRRIETEWKALWSRTADLADAVAGVVRNIPERPVINWPPRISPGLFLPGDDDWRPVSEVVESQLAELSELVEQEIPRVQEIASAAEGELANAERGLRVKQAMLSRRLSEIESEQAENESLKHRIATLEEDIQRNKDVKTLQRLGSQAATSVGDGMCPVCHQAIQDSLAPLDEAQSVMSIDDNIRFLTEQRRTFLGVLANAGQMQQARERKATSEREAIVRLRLRIRSLRQTLISDGRLPSAAAIQARLELEQSLHWHQAAAEKLDSLMGDFEELSGQWRDVQAKIRALPSDDTTAEDRNKLSDWSKALRSQLSQYEFRSLAIPPIAISNDSYRPEHEGFDLQTSISASDLIRTIWSYLHGLLEVSRTRDTNHPGFILFDEPRQQSTRDASFEQLLIRASEADQQQVILFTSEKRERLDAALEGIPHTLRAFDGRVLTEAN